MAKFEIFFLGTSAGIPSIRRNMPCIAIRVNGLVYLFDVGECCQRQLMRYRVGYGSISAIFISHLHLDHFLGVYGLIETLRMTTDKPYTGLRIFAPKGFQNLLINRWEFLDIKRIKQGKLMEEKDIVISAFRNKHIPHSYGFVIEEKPRRKFNAEKAHKLGIRGRLFSILEEKGSVIVGGRKITIDEVSTLVKGRKIVYSGDTMPSKNTIAYAKDADILIHEATFDEKLEENAKKTAHSTVKDAAIIAKEANVKTLVLTHISARYKNAAFLKRQAKKYFDGEIIIARDGLVLSL